jgi:hypothetical protein
MTQLKWLEDAEGFVSGEYHIRRVDDASRYRWCLETRGEAARSRGGSVTPSYASLRDAKGAAHRAERERLQRDTVIGHAVVGFMAFVALAALFPTIGNLSTFVIAMLLFYFGLRSLTFSISAKLGDAWGWSSDGGTAPPRRMSDRLVRAGIAWLRGKSVAAVDTQPAGAVRVLPPGPPQ